MKITWHGTATLTVEGEQGKVLFDPFLRRNKKLTPIDAAALAEVDAAFITHPHFDHFCDLESFFKAGLPIAYVCKQGIESAKKNGFQTESIDRLEELLAGQAYTVGDLTIRSYMARHSKLDARTVFLSTIRPRNLWSGFTALSIMKLHKKFPIDGTTFAFEVTDGEKTALIFGSAGLEENVAYPKNADLLVFPYQGCSHLEKLASEITGLLTPERVMFDHYEDAFPPISFPQSKAVVLTEMRDKHPEIEAFFAKENVAYTI